ncbi:imidazolonepropionase [Bradyrhizobium lablabi]|uniref:Imidazolonepropionase n=1 Tax=Bradyrhizobium lablabi TaxID=722472 RepID=A0A1M7A9T0_9BRAD|nr:imidazolonepropionase [Bradyrhizobium lablabi]SHL39460.1 imidazolonepropionase [Bradyrhizobium lablabi]
MTLVDHIWQRCRLATLSPSRQGLGLIDDGLIAARDGRIVYAGTAADAPSALDAKQRTDCDGRWISPGLIDCHTHLVYGGNRAHEFEERLAGASYEEIARAGGGIVSTVKATRQASTDELVATALPRLDALIAEGVTAIEIKSGYGLELATERRQLQAARRLAGERPISVRTTFLGAHTVPSEMAGNKQGYIDKVCNEMLPPIAAEGLADAVDAFCEGIAFSVEQTAQVFSKAKALGLPLRLHADQLSNLHGAALAARFGALSADHLEYADEDGVAAMARAGTVAVVLPGAFYFIREHQIPPIEAMRRHGVPIALATDSNPGTSPLTSLLLTMNMGATLFRLTVDECIAAVTREAARALGLFEQTGSLDAGKSCDLAIWDIERPAELVYRMGFNPLHARVWRGTSHPASSRT